MRMVLRALLWLLCNPRRIVAALPWLLSDPKRVRASLRQLFSHPRILATASSHALTAEPSVQYLLNEISDLKIAVRKLSASLMESQPDRLQTKDSFSYQWEEIREGAALLGDAAWESQMVEQLCTYSGYSEDWFKGKKVLDAGCGNGRWSYVLSELGADVMAIDQSSNGINSVKTLLANHPTFNAQQADILSPLPFSSEFDLVWCYGVTHHTGYTELACKNVAATVKPGGRLFLMIYGEPTKLHEFAEINTYVEHRRATGSMTFDEKRAYLSERYPEELVHGYFDAVSPEINDLHRWDEVEGWLIELGFTRIRRTSDNRNLHLVADLPC